VRRGSVVALAVTLALVALGAHAIVRERGAVAQSPRGSMTPAQSAVTVAQSAVTKDEVGDEVQTVPRGQVPVFADEGDGSTLYRFATTRGDVLRWMPCTCGCAQIGHTSNRSCYIKGETETSVTYTSHAAT
jgi:hypothetical protein